MRRRGGGVRPLSCTAETIRRHWPGCRRLLALSCSYADWTTYVALRRVSRLLARTVRLAQASPHTVCTPPIRAPPAAFYRRVRPLRLACPLALDVDQQLAHIVAWPQQLRVLHLTCGPSPACDLSALGALPNLATLEAPHLTLRIAGSPPPRLVDLHVYGCESRTLARILGRCRMRSLRLRTLADAHSGDERVKGTHAVVEALVLHGAALVRLELGWLTAAPPWRDFCVPELLAAMPNLRAIAHVAWLPLSWSGTLRACALERVTLCGVHNDVHQLLSAAPRLRELCWRWKEHECKDRNRRACPCGGGGGDSDSAPETAIRRPWTHACLTHLELRDFIFLTSIPFLIGRMAQCVRAGARIAAPDASQAFPALVRLTIRYSHLYKRASGSSLPATLTSLSLLQTTTAARAAACFSSATVRELCLDLDGGGQGYTDVLNVRFPGLTRLHLLGHDGFLDAELASRVRRLGRLRVLVLSTQFGEQQPPPPPPPLSARDFYTELARGMPQLVRLQIDPEHRLCDVCCEVPKHRTKPWSDLQRAVDGLLSGRPGALVSPPTCTCSPFSRSVRL